MGLFDAIAEFFRAIWSFIKRMVVGIINFFQNIASWFKTPRKLQMLKQNRKLLAVSIKRNLEDNNYNVINCLYDTEKEDIVGEYDVSNQDAAGLEASGLDSETKKHFGNKDMIILK